MYFHNHFQIFPASVFEHHFLKTKQYIQPIAGNLISVSSAELEVIPHTH